MKILSIRKRGEEAVRDEIKRLIKEALAERGGEPCSVFPTGGTSAPFWGPALFGDPAGLRNAHLFLTDTFSRALAVAEGRNDTNEDAVHKVGLGEALATQALHPSQLAWPDHRLGGPEAIAAAWSAELLRRRGAHVADIMIASGGGGDYRKGGPADPGHFLGVPHGQPGLFERRAPFITVTGMPKPPSVRISAAPWLAEEAGLLLVFVLGESKRQTVANILSGMDPVECPAATVCRARNGVLVHDSDLE